MKIESKGRFYVYIVECADKTFYTGYTVDLDKRVKSHNAGKGAKYTRGRKPVKLVWSKACRKLKTALELERSIKKLPRGQKEALVCLVLRVGGGTFRYKMENVSK